MKQKTLARIALVPGFGWLIMLFVAPFLLLIALSVATTDILGQPVYGWNLDSFQQIFSFNFLGIMGRSLAYAAATTLICLVLGFVAAYTIARYGGRHRTLLVLLCLVPWFVDYLVRIYAWIQILGEPGVIGNLAHAIGIAGNINFLGHSTTVIAGLVYNFLPYMLLALYLSIDQLDPRLLEASRDLYAGSAATFFGVVVPQTLPGIVTGCTLVFLPAVGDFATAQFLGTPNQYMIGNLIQSEAQTPGALPIAAGLTLLLVLVLAAVTGLAALTLTPLRRRWGLQNG